VAAAAGGAAGRASVAAGCVAVRTVLSSRIDTRVDSCVVVSRASPKISWIALITSRGRAGRNGGRRRAPAERPDGT
jgi:hypothetical protein